MISIALPFCLFESIKLITLGLLPYLELQRSAAKFYADNAAIVFLGSAENLSVREIAMQRLNFLKQYFYPAEIIFLPATFYMLYAALKYREIKNKNALQAGCTLLLSFFVYIYWWIFFSNGFDRYLVVSLCCYVVGIAFLLSAIDYKKFSKIGVVAIAIFVALLFASRFGEIEYLFKKGFVGNDHGLQRQKIIVDAINDLKAQAVTTISCGNNAELEYLLPASRNFQRCEDFIAGKIKGRVVLVNYFLNAVTQPPRFIRIDYNQQYGGTRMVPDVIAIKCNRQYLAGEDFSINWCTSD